MTHIIERKMTRLEDRIIRAISNAHISVGLKNKNPTLLITHVNELTKHRLDFQVFEDTELDDWLDTLDPAEMRDRITANRDLHKEIDTVLTLLHTNMSILHTTGTRGQGATSHGQSTDDIRLPKVELTVFSGDPNTWDAFWANFTAHVHGNSKVPEVTKFNYLASVLKGVPRTILDNYQPTVDGYKDAIDELIKHYSDANRQRESVIDRLLDILPPDNQHSSLFSFKIKVTGVLNDMEHLGIDIPANEAIVRRCIIRKTPGYIMQHVYQITGMYPPLVKILEAFDDIVKRGRDKPKGSNSSEGKGQSSTVSTPSSESLSTRGSGRGSGGYSSSSRGRGSYPRGRGGRGNQHYGATSTAIMFGSATERYPCVFCGQAGHNPRNCHNVPTVKARVNALARQDLCNRCIGKHPAKQGCSKIWECYSCGGDHHAWLCLPQSIGGGNDPSSR